MVYAQTFNILALLQKIENKCSVTSKHVILENVGISTSTVFSGEIASPLVKENSSPVDNVEEILILLSMTFYVMWTICSMKCLQKFSPKKWRKLLLPLSS